MERKSILQKNIVKAYRKIDFFFAFPKISNGNNCPQLIMAPAWHTAKAVDAENVNCNTHCMNKRKTCKHNSKEFRRYLSQLHRMSQPDCSRVAIAHLRQAGACGSTSKFPPDGPPILLFHQRRPAIDKKCGAGRDGLTEGLRSYTAVFPGQ